MDIRFEIDGDYSLPVVIFPHKPDFYLGLRKVLASEGRRYISNVTSHWLTSTLVIEDNAQKAPSSWLHVWHSCLHKTWVLIQYKDDIFQHRESHYGDKTIFRPSYLHNEISYTGKMTVR